MSKTPHRSRFDSRLETFFVSVNAASIVAIILYSLFFFGYLLTHQSLIEAIQTAISQGDYIGLQLALESVDAGVMSVTGWVRLAIGLGLILVSLLFVLNLGGIIFKVFIHRPFHAGGKATVSWLRLSLSRTYLTARLLLFIALYKATGLRGFQIVQEFFPDNPIVSASFFFSSAMSLGTLVVLASVIKVVVYEVRRYETLVEENRTSVLSAINEYLNRWKNQMIILEEGRFSQDSGYVKAKLEDATRDMRSNLRLLEQARSDLSQQSSPETIIRKLMLTFIGVVVLQIITDGILYVGWGNILQFIFGQVAMFDWFTGVRP